MPRPSTLHLPPLDPGSEPVPQRLTRLRKERGFTQVELARAIGITQTLVSDYERGKLRLNADMIVRFALALEVATDDILRPRRPADRARRPSPRVARRIERIESLPAYEQRTLLTTIDKFLAAARR